MFISMPDGIRLFTRTLAGPTAGAPTLIVPNGVIVLDDLVPLSRTHRVIAYDLRNRGASDASPAATGIPGDVDDLAHLIATLGISRCATLAHSYVALVALQHAMRHPAVVDRVVVIGAPPPDPATTYPPDLAYTDDVLPRAHAALGALFADPTLDPMTRFARAWDALRPVYVADPRHADALRVWERPELPNEHTFMGYFMSVVTPSIAALRWDAPIGCPVLVVHGRKDRSAPFGAALDWVARLPAAALLEVSDAAHAPWIEDETVMPAIARFLYS